jgi:hypothetical protein
MTNKPLSTVGLIMPVDFPVKSYEEIQSYVVDRKDSDPELFLQYAGAFNAIAYRFYTCTEHDRIFTESVKRHGSMPPPQARYIQEKELFGFFVTGLSTIESFCYGLFAIGAMTRERENFSFKTDKDKRRIDPEITGKTFKQTFPREAITASLNKLLSDNSYNELKDIRNTLAHRTSPGRTMYSGSRNDKTLGVKDIQIDETTTAVRRKWLAITINLLLNEASDFTRGNIQ